MGEPQDVDWGVHRRGREQLQSHGAEGGGDPRCPHWPSPQSRKTYTPSFPLVSQRPGHCSARDVSCGLRICPPRSVQAARSFGPGWGGAAGCFWVGPHRKGQGWAPAGHGLRSCPGQGHTPLRLGCTWWHPQPYPGHLHRRPPSCNFRALSAELRAHLTAQL